MDLEKLTERAKGQKYWNAFWKRYTALYGKQMSNEVTELFKQMDDTDVPPYDKFFERAAELMAKNEKPAPQAPEKITDAEFDKLQKICDAATVGPWARRECVWINRAGDWWATGCAKDDTVMPAPKLPKFCEECGGKVVRK